MRKIVNQRIIFRLKHFFEVKSKRCFCRVNKISLLNIKTILLKGVVAFTLLYEFSSIPGSMSKKWAFLFWLRREFSAPGVSSWCMNSQNTITHLFILVSSNCNEFRFFEDICPESGVRKLQNVVGSDQMKTRLVLVHGV